MKNFLQNSSFHLFLLFGFYSFGFDPNIRFSMDCSQSQIYSGQTTLCQFVVKAPYDVLEVEVVKFPEFKGYWSENISLRQGPIALAPEINERGQLSGLRIAQVGSYLIHSMVGKKDSHIEPMKLLVKRRAFPPSDESKEATIYIAEGKPLEILDLPPIPTELSHLPFTGAVGILSLSPMDTQIRFHPNEPLNLRFTLTGQGNFAEINSLPITLFKDAELLSKRSYQQGTGDFASKSFDYQLLIHRQAAFEESFGSFLIFNPFSKKYLVLEYPKFQFTPLPPESLNRNRAPIELPNPTRTQTPAILFRTDPIFWTMQLAFGIFLALIHFKRHLNKTREAFLESSAYKMQLKWELTEKAEQSQNIEAFVKSASELAQDVLAEKLTIIRPNSLPKRQLLRLAHSKLPVELIQPMQELFAANDQLYSPKRTPNLKTQQLMQHLRTVAAKR